MINIVCALDCEARPLIDYYRLRSVPGAQGFKLYRSEQIQLIVSGMGSIAAAVAVGYLAASTAGRNAAWLNVGVAGHASADIGSLFVAGKIMQHTGDYQAFPALLFHNNLPVSGLLTVDRVLPNYPQDIMLDMEAAGFFQTAIRFSPLELVQCVKIISDNSVQQHEQVNAKAVITLINTQMPAIDEMVKAMSCMQQQLQDPELDNWLVQLFSAVRFSQYQQRQVARLAQRWLALLPHKPLPDPAFPELPQRNAASVLAELQQAVETVEPDFNQ